MSSSAPAAGLLPERYPPDRPDDAPSSEVPVLRPHQRAAPVHKKSTKRKLQVVAAVVSSHRASLESYVEPPLLEGVSSEIIPSSPSTIALVHAYSSPSDKPTDVDRRRSFVAAKTQHASERRAPTSANKVVPNYLVGGPMMMQTRTYDAHMQRLSLRFFNAQLEEVFRKHYKHYVLGKVQTGCTISIALHVIMGTLEILGGYSTPHERELLVARCAMVGLALLFYHVTTKPSFQLRFEAWMIAYYLVYGTCVVATSVLFESLGASSSVSSPSLYFFYAGRWSQAISLIFISILFNASGMMFTMATLCAWFHILLMLLVPLILYPARPELQNSQIVYGPVLTCFCMLSAYNSEKHIRKEFVLRCNVTEDRKRRDDLLETMLPAHIKESLKENRTDQLAEQFDEVSILFCYVSDFGRLSKTTPAIELVQLMNRIFFCFDKATDSRGVYKVEAIAETYMCAAGVPIKDPYHHEKIADMALTMMYIQEQEKWMCHGELIRLKIGIHSGPVVAGVIGSKTYSYHLFGDTVNTSSRVCSSSKPGKIQISEKTYGLLKRSGCYDITPRGKVPLKGKGELMLYWLERKVALPPPSRDDFGMSTRFDLAEEKTIAWTPKVKAVSETKSDTDGLVMNKRTLAFQAKGGTSKRRVTPSSSTLERRMETSFIVDYNMANVMQFRWALKAAIGVLAMAVVVGAGIPGVALVVNSSNKWPSVALNSVGVVLLSLLYAYSYRRVFLSRMQTAAGLVIGLVIVGLNVNIVLNAKSDFLNLNLIFITIVSLLMRFRFVTSVAINVTLLMFYLGFLVYSRHDFSNIIGLVCITIFCTVIGEYSCYRREIGLRADFLLKHSLNVEKKKCEELLANMLPSPQYAEALLLHGTIVDELDEVTLLYSDMVGFTALSATLKPVESCLFLNKVYSAFDRHLDAFGVYKMDTVGDAFIVIGGLPNYKSEKHHAVAITAFAIEMLREMDEFRRSENVNLQMRIGIHTGKVVGGVVGIKKPRYLIWGSHTVIANSMESKSIPGRIQVSDSTYNILQETGQYAFEARGAISIGEAETISTYFVQTDKAPKKETIVSKFFSTPQEKKLKGKQSRAELELEELIRDARRKNPFFMNVETMGEGSKILHKIVTPTTSSPRLSPTK
ncbi:Aste57867_14452 [Aphanomyces stellatus]|uniref:Aste57867_14452 protein n=1 Tax=Aphanomyces stellatus TaxID=120398 RepID=A0A485L1I4_9STRA|nr:hypothetical protein As57867_014398 [Aphanomyces stellatus]VFT91274.1 Aste57867_14452 [Aphanomyces stellatus]